MHAAMLEYDGQKHTGKCDHSADRQIDAAREDDEGHADGGDAEEGIVGQKVSDHAGREHVRILRDAERVT